MDPRYHATLASLGQRYQDMPPATFDQRFGPYDTPRPDVPPEAKEQLRRLFEEQMLRDTPEGIIPGQRTWPYGFIQTQAPRPTLQQLAGDVVQGPWGNTPRQEPASSAPLNYMDILRRQRTGGPPITPIMPSSGTIIPLINPKG